MLLTTIISILPFYQVNNYFDGINIKGIKTDSRKVMTGDLFVCINGFTVDGHDFVKQAELNGAVAIMAEKKVETSLPMILVKNTTHILPIIAGAFYHYPTQQLPLIGVTGTNGKTTVTYLLEKIFHYHGQKTGIIGTIQMKIGSDSYPTENTTPNALQLQQTLKKMLDEKVDMVVMEVSSHALDQGRVNGCDFDIAIFTNLSQDHLDYHKDMNDYLRAKSLLFSQLGNRFEKAKQKFAIFNADDPASDVLKKMTAHFIMDYGCHGDADVLATNIDLRANGTLFTLRSPRGTIKITSQLVGMFNVYNMLAAAAAAIAYGIPLTTIKYAFNSISGVSGRFERVEAGQSYTVLVDYAHTPDSLENVLQTIEDFKTNHIYVVVGCGGDRDRTKRPLMASVALKYADHVIFTSDNPRTERPDVILRDMTKGLSPTAQYEVIENRKKAIHQIISLAKKGDIVLIAGKGHETYQQIGHVKYGFDDREVAKHAINQKEY